MDTASKPPETFEPGTEPKKVLDFTFLSVSLSLVVIVVGAALFLQSGQAKLLFGDTTHALADATSTPEYKVMYTGAGFSPASLVIPIGSKVAFKNESGISLQVASDPFPSHTDYDDFYSEKSYAPGGTYTFQFTRSGSFGYYNESNSSDHGFIKVTDVAHPPVEIDETPVGQRPIRDKLLTLFNPDDINSIFTVFDAIESNPTLAVSCHEVGHSLGHEAYELYGFSGAMTFSNPERKTHTSVENICAGGYMHGILEEVFIHQPELKNEPGLLCSGVPSANAASCYHGVGHALMFVNKREISASLDGCRGLANVNNTSRCFEGVWMEEFWGSIEHAATTTLGWDANHPLAPCIAAAADAKPACFLYSSFGYLRNNPQQYAGAVALCTKSGLSENSAEYCLKGVGITMISHFGGKHLEQSEPYVDGLTDVEKYAFYQGITGYALLSDIGRSELVASCNALVRDQNSCLSALASE